MPKIKVQGIELPTPGRVVVGKEWDHIPRASLQRDFTMLTDPGSDVRPYMAAILEIEEINGRHYLVDPETQQRIGPYPTAENAWIAQQRLQILGMPKT